MSMYNLIFGENQQADALLALLGLSKHDFYRYRDCYLTEDNRIAVYTRGGGNNRDCWTDECDDDNHVEECVVTRQNKLRGHPLYASSADDDFDNTYATFFFRIPDKAELEGVAAEPDRNRMWLDFLDALHKNTKTED